MRYFTLKRALFMSSALVGLSFTGGVEAQACDYDTVTQDITCGTNTASTDTLILDGAQSPVVRPGSDAITNGGSIGSTINGIIDIGRNSDDLTVSNMTINGEKQSVDVNASPSGIFGSIFGGNGGDNIMLNNVTTAGSVLGDYGAGTNAGVDTITVDSSTIGGSLIGGGGADTIIVNGGSTITRGIGYRDLVTGIDREDGGDEIIVNNGIFGVNDSGTPATTDDYSIYTGHTGDRVYLFGGQIQSDIILARDEGAIDRLYIDPGAWGGVNGVGGIGSSQYSNAFVTNFVTHETNALMISATSFDGGDGNDEVFIYNTFSTGSGQASYTPDPSATIARQEVLQANTVWNSFSDLVLSNSVLDIADSSAQRVELHNYSALVQKDGLLTISANDGGNANTFLVLDETSVVDMMDGAVDDRIDVDVFNVTSGSLLMVDADVSAVGYDAEASDYIFNGTGGSNHNNANGDPARVNVNVIGTPSLSGARRLVDDVDLTQNDVDPGAGATPDPSSAWTFADGTDPSSAARTFWLQDDGNGVYLMWTTPVNAQTTGGFIGGGGSSASGSGSGSPAPAPGPEQAALGIALAAAPMAVNANIAAMARADAGLNLLSPLNPIYPDPANGPASDLDDPQNLQDMAMRDCSGRSGLNAWADADAVTGDLGTSGFDGLAARFGIEADIGRNLLDQCNRWIAGAFGYLGAAGADDANGGTIDTDSYGGGLYIRMSDNDGFYNSFLGHYGNGEVSSFSPVLNSTASYEGALFGVAGNMGRKFALASDTVADIRGFLNITSFEADPFSDSMGLAIDALDLTTMAYGADVGLEHAFTQNSTGFARAGFKYTDFEGDVTSSGSTVSFSSEFLTATAEVGFTTRFGENTELTLSGTGEFGEDVTLYGGRLRLKIEF